MSSATIRRVTLISKTAMPSNAAHSSKTASKIGPLRYDYAEFWISAALQILVDWSKKRGKNDDHEGAYSASR